MSDLLTRAAEQLDLAAKGLDQLQQRSGMAYEAKRIELAREYAKLAAIERGLLPAEMASKSG